MHTKKMIFAVVALAGALAVGFLAGSRREGGKLSAVPVVRTYQVAPERAEEVRNSLNRVLRPNDNDATGFAQVFGNGLLLVRAPDSFQRGIGHLISQLAAEKSSPRATVHLDYYLIVGQEGPSNADSFPQLATVLSAIAKVDGGRKFRVLEHLSANVLTGSESEVKGNLAKAKSMAVVRNDRVGLRLEFISRLGEVKTDTQVKPGEFLVLGQNAIARDFETGNLKIPGEGTNVYYVIRTELAQN